VPRLDFLVPGALTQRTGGSFYDAHMVAGLHDLGWDVTVHELVGRYPDADARARNAVAAALADTDLPVLDGLCLAAAGDGLGGRGVALVHHPAALETGLDAATAARLEVAERAALAHAARTIATSPHTAAILTRDYGVPVDRLGVVVPGTDPASRAAGSDGTHLLCVATLTRRKGHATLVAALARLADLDWTLDCVGSLDRDAATATAVRDAIDRHGLADRIVLAGELDAAGVAAAYHRADVFVLASHYEGYGMVLGEALARGLPVVACAGGAVADTVPADAGLLVPPGDVDALAVALRRVLTEPGLRDRLAAGARAARLPDWPTQTRAFAAELAKVGV